MRASTNLVILLIAIAMGGVAAFLARDWLASHSASVEPGATPGTIVVASAPLGFGAAVTADNVTEIPWSSTTLPDGAFMTVHDLIKDGPRVVLSPLVRNEPVVASKVTAPNQRGSLSTTIKEGSRAVTVPVDDVRGVAGFIFPGDFVDVVLTRTGNNEGPQNYSEVILQRVKVLAIDQQAGERQDKPTVAKAVTVELTAEQSLKILLATNVGRLSLILRQANEDVAGPNKRITEHDLFTEDAPTPTMTAIADAFAAAQASTPNPKPTPVAIETPAPAVGETQPPSGGAGPEKLTATVGIVRGMKRDEYEVQKVSK